MKYTISTLDELSDFCLTFLQGLKRGSSANIVLLEGKLGVGKTAFVKACAVHLGLEQDITSPTFVIQKEYELNGKFPWDTLIHIDAYRLKNKEELEYLRWQDLISDSKKIIFLEWPSIVTGIDTPGAITISLSINQDKTRELVVRGLYK